MNYRTIIVDKEEGVAIITLNQPDLLNPVNSEVTSELTRAIEAIEQDEEMRAVMVTGAGRAFSAGGDVKNVLGKESSPVKLEEQARGAARMVAAMKNMPKPLIAAVNGPAVGAGFNIAMACDIIIAAEDARFGSAFIALGLHPDSGGVYFLTHLVGFSRACELIFTGKTIDAREAEKIGIVNQVVAAEQLQETAKELAVSLAAGPTKAIGLAKTTIYQTLDKGMDSGLEAEVKAFALSLATEDADEGIKAFLEKRRPLFKGR